MNPIKRTLSNMAIVKRLQECSAILDDAARYASVARIMSLSRTARPHYVKKHRECIDKFNQMKPWFLKAREYQH